MANAMSTNTPSANKMLFFVALLMPYASHLCTFVWIVYIMRTEKGNTVLHPLPRESSRTMAFEQKIIANPIQSAGAEGSDNS